MQLYYLIYYLPCIMSLVWFFNLVFKVRTERQTVFMWILLLSVIYFAAYITYILPGTDYYTMVRMDAINIVPAYALQSLQIVYLNIQRTGRGARPVHLLLGIPAIALGTAINLLYFIIGFDEAASYYEMFDTMNISPYAIDNTLVSLLYFLDDDFANFLSAAYFLVALYVAGSALRRHGYRLGDSLRFFFRGKRSTTPRVTCVLNVALIFSILPLIVFGRAYLMHHPLVACACTISIAICLHLMSFVEIHSDTRPTFTLYDLAHITMFPIDSGDSSTEATEGSEAASSAAAETASPRERKIDIIVEHILHLLEDEHIYRNDDLTLVTLSEITGVGKSTLSSIINQRFDMPFRELVATYRIAAAKRYMLENPAAMQEAIASACGFKDASSFNRKFREVEGTTPLLWLAAERFTPREGKAEALTT